MSSNEESSNGDSTNENRSRRRFITGLTSAAWAVSAAYAAVPLVLSMTPSARARNAGAPVEFDFSKLQAGQMVKVEWRGMPVVVLRRTPAMMAGLDEVTELLADPDSADSVQPGYAQNPARADANKNEILVMLSVCTHLGCSPVEKLAVGPDPEMGEDSKGGFFCPCHGSKFDLAGRVYKNVPANKNMVIPPYQYLDENVILIGDDEARNA
ncbi:MAG: ubiquinol-cytochrome c reductase iron-sulfur subunit [Proteobacteria bacterium]|jgi:ubiquinol-cytochrome c reductase iron-sulfur subunit|nr:ubiquinol-cytochrome c reductase iron-sulfur subunit [Pseudomonadota bacterium]